MLRERKTCPIRFAKGIVQDAIFRYAVELEN